MNNGELTSKELSVVYTGDWLGKRTNIYLYNITAVAYFAMLKECKKETGLDFEPALPAGGYRDLKTQHEMRNDYYNKIWWRYNLDPNSSVPPAVPGYSNHGLGICVDIWGGGFQWVIENGKRFGFTRPFPTRDPHHFQHNAKPYISPQLIEIIPIEKDEIEMKNSAVYYDAGNNTIVYLIFNYATGRFHEYSNGAGKGPMPANYNNAIAETFGTGPFARVTKGHADEIKDALNKQIG